MPNNLLSATLVIAIVVLFAVYWEEQRPNIKQAGANLSPSQNPDLVLHNTMSSRFGEDGQLKYEVRSIQAQRLPALDIIRLKKPRMTSYDDAKGHWYLSAEWGESRPKGEVLRLIEDVTITNPKTQLAIRTSELTITPDKKYAQTSKPVTIKDPGSTTTTVGLKAFLAEERIELLSNVKTHYETK
jgi:lipopolysaccharide export system protein LptC